MDSATGSERPCEPAHEDYRWTLITLKVQDKVYRVPRHGFTRYSGIFETMFTLPQGDDSTEGRSDDNPIILPSCTTEEFESLLSVLYPTAPHLQPTILSKEQWIHILKVSTLWDMEEVRALSIKEILAMNPAAIEKVTLAREFKIPAWLLEGYLEIIKSWGNVGYLDDIGSGLGWESAARLADMARNYSLKRRETVNATVPGAYCNHCARLWKWNGGQVSRSFELSAENPTESPNQSVATRCPYCQTWTNILSVDLISRALMEEPELESATKEAFKAELELLA
ncbi:hypothetical protein DFP72DRAFT_903584 [Ephemerocybe angulata]|uniref:BTB domain-containing protein n=1 Tax=Ephemerocybe angulata TaxID=980116 RepID=A0A8H6M645_9AGAR|nr:hypothetical protein DFP72DRAFT_903584 [Tulosesus angulatus]